MLAAMRRAWISAVGNDGLLLRALKSRSTFNPVRRSGSVALRVVVAAGAGACGSGMPAQLRLPCKFLLVLLEEDRRGVA